MEKQNNLKNVYLLGIVSFLNDLSSEMIAPVLPVFINLLGGGGIALGLVGGLRQALSSVLKLFSGYFSDKFKKRKIFVYLGYGISGIFKILLGFSNNITQVITASSLERIGKGLRTAPRDAIISESLPEKQGKAFGLHRAFDTFGATLGVFVALFLLWHFQKVNSLSLIKKIIIFAGFISLSSLIPLFFVKEKTKKDSEKKSQSLKIAFKSLDRRLKIYLISVALFSLAEFSYMFFVLRGQNVFSQKFVIIGPTLLYLIFNLSYALFSYPFGLLADKVGKKKVILFGYLIFALVSFFFFVPFKKYSLVLYIFLFVLYGLSYAIIDANQRAYMGDTAPKELIATAQGSLQLTIGIFGGLGNLIAGFLWNISNSLPFAFASLFALFSAFLFWQVK